MDYSDGYAQTQYQTAHARAHNLYPGRPYFPRVITICIALSLSPQNLCLKQLSGHCVSPSFEPLSHHRPM